MYRALHLKKVKKSNGSISHSFRLKVLSFSCLCVLSLLFSSPRVISFHISMFTTNLFYLSFSETTSAISPLKPSQILSSEFAIHCLPLTFYLLTLGIFSFLSLNQSCFQTVFYFLKCKISFQTAFYFLKYKISFRVLTKIFP